jgi:hypothetical protein
VITFSTVKVTQSTIFEIVLSDLVVVNNIQISQKIRLISINSNFEDSIEN